LDEIDHHLRGVTTVAQRRVAQGDGAGQALYCSLEVSSRRVRYDPSWSGVSPTTEEDRGVTPPMVSKEQDEGDRRRSMSSRRPIIDEFARAPLPSTAVAAPPPSVVVTAKGGSKRLAGVVCSLLGALLLGWSQWEVSGVVHSWLSATDASEA